MIRTRFPDSRRLLRYARSMKEPTVKPLFVPLKSRYFRAFESGVKTVEYRRCGRGWNERTCWIGRPVTLSHGYSGARLTARINSVRVIAASEIADPDPYLPTDTLIAIDLVDIRPAP